MYVILGIILFLIGMILGGIVAVFIICLCVAAHDADKHYLATIKEDKRNDRA